MEFFNTIWFGISAMLIVGGSWCLTGVVMGKAPKRHIDPSMVQLFGAFFSCCVSIFLLLFLGPSRCSASVLLLTCASYAIGGVIGFCALQLMAHAMQKGPNGLIWSIYQSALIWPFIGGVLIFHMKTGWLRLTGLMLVVIALLLFALCKENKRSTGIWLRPSLLAFLFCGLQQNFTVAPSYFEEAREVSSITRMLATSFGGLSAAIAYNLVLTSPKRCWNNIRSHLSNRVLWKYVCILQFFGLIISYTLFFPGMNAMAAVGAGGICYPLMAGSCIVFFTIICAVFLREKICLLQICAMFLCISGMVGLCWS